MTYKTELFTLHANDLLEMLGTSINDGGTLTLATGDGEELEVDLDDLCLCVRVESLIGTADDEQGDVLPFGN